MLSFEDIIQAKNRISNHILKTELFVNDDLNKEFDNQIFFKLDNRQKTGSFKIRGALNHILMLKEQGRMPKKIAVVTSGNHGAAVAYACQKFNIECLIYTSKITPISKINNMKKFGAEVIITNKRQEANKLAAKKIEEGYEFIHPSSGDSVIAGQGTIFLEDLNSDQKFDAVFAPCGGGGLVSGIYVASKICQNQPEIFAVEPEIANDAQISLKDNDIFVFKDSPKTIADGARSLCISDNTFKYLKNIAGIIDVSENNIIYWQKRVGNLLNQDIEPTSALSMAGCVKWIKENNIKNKSIFVVISGGNS
ncbi:pyridoxal-phosphate dependent enzyme [Rickettsiales bacterium]|nr:pyridoxal-phosphate dependent enzyme [Rickettsiales bacterium]